MQIPLVKLADLIQCWYVTLMASLIPCISTVNKLRLYTSRPSHLFAHTSTNLFKRTRSLRQDYFQQLRRSLAKEQQALSATELA